MFLFKFSMLALIAALICWLMTILIASSLTGANVQQSIMEWGGRLSVMLLLVGLVATAIAILLL